MAIWAKAKNVLRNVRPIVGTTKRLDVTRFSMETVPLRAYLPGKEGLLLRGSGIAYSAP
jgi:hypothetical protein